MSSDQQYPYAPNEPQGDGRHRQPRQPDPDPYPYEPQAPPYEPQAQQAQQAPQGYGPQSYEGRPYAGQAAAYGGYGAQDQDMEATQVWQGQTWDTASQPIVEGRQVPQVPQGHHPAAPAEQGRPYPPSAAPYAPYAPYAAGAPQVSAMEETAYVPVQGAPPAPAPDPGSGSYPLPPEMPTRGQAQAPGPAAYPQPGPAAQAAQPAPEYTPPAPSPAPAAAGQHADAQNGAPQGDGSQGDGPHGPHADGFGAPTTLGTARLTDAQRARAEGRSPIIPPGAQPAGLTAVLGLLLAGGAALGSYALLVPVVILQAVTAAGWFRLNGMWPARQGIALAFLGGLVSDVALLAAGRSHAPAAIVGTLGVWVLLTVVVQLRSHADPDTRLTGLLATVVSAALAIVATGHLGAPSDAVVVGAVAVAAATPVRALPLPGPASVAAALVAAAVVGAAMGGLTGFGAAGALAVGLGAGVCALVGLRAASYDYPSRFVHMTAGVALPLTAAAPAVYLLGRAFG